MIDTLKLSRTLHDKAGFTQDAADATADAINSSLGEDVATKIDIQLLDNKMTLLDGKVTLLDGKITFVLWAIGINAAATIAMLVKHW